MIFIALFWAAAVLASPQDEVADLIRKLEAERIETRENAAHALVRLGEKVREPVRKALESAAPQLKALLEGILRSLDHTADLARWSPRIPRISLSGEMTLRQAAEEIERQGGPPVRCDAWPEGKFRIDVSDESFWNALEAACRASGRRTLICDAGGPRLSGDRYVAIPSIHGEGVRIHAGSVTENRVFFIESKKDQLTFHLDLHVGWAGPVAPLVAVAVLSSASDAAGNDLIPLLMGRQPAVASRPAPRTYGTLLHLVGVGEADPSVKKIAAMKGIVTLLYRASEEPLTVSLRSGKGDPAAKLFYVNEALEEVGSSEVTMHMFVRGRDGFSCAVRFLDLEKHLRQHVQDWRMRDKEGKSYPGSIQRTTITSRWTDVTVDFGTVPEGVEVSTVELDLPRRLIRQDIPFELKDIRIK